ncbi:MAG: response regulator [Oscillospiraceae bacterium]|nr:response regulator [Oscillospiraceae bacterium]
MLTGNKPTILCVDDDSTNLKLMNEILKEEYTVYLAPSASRAIAFLRLGKLPNLILLDVEMPNMNGYEAIKAIKEVPEWKDIPILFLTGLEGRDKEQEAFALGAVDYILKPISAGIVKARVRLHTELETYRKHLESLVLLRTRQLNMTQDCILDMLANVTSYRDNETGVHIKCTTYYTELIADALVLRGEDDYKMTEEYADSVKKSAKLHDIGKVAVPDHILLKPGRLTDEEFDCIKMHTVYGARMLDNAMEDLGETSSFLEVAREIIIGHHEKWNGKGYPFGISEKEIPLSARVMAIVDVYDALISVRPYKTPFTHEDAVGVLKKDAGLHFDPYLIDFCGDLFEQFKIIGMKHLEEDLNNAPEKWR